MTLFNKTILAVSITLTLAACGSSDDNNETTPTPPPELSPLPTEKVTIEVGNSNVKALKESHVVTSPDGEETLASIETFKGITYATAERFDHSGVLDMSEEVDAQDFGFACPQLKTTSQPQSEDCLNLNIWRPADLSTDVVLPVYVFIHGGDFEYGAGSEPLIHGDTVVAQGAAEGNPFIAITLNYRLGMLGSHWLKDNQGGNYGLGDQKRALEWVNNNIADFGGDIENITLIGQGAGAMSVGILQQEATEEPMAGEYFTRAIMQSNPAGFDYRSYDQASDFATKITDYQAEMEDIDQVDLKALPLDQLMQVQAKASSALSRIGDWTGLSCVDLDNLVGSGLCLTSKLSGEITPMANLMPFAPYIEYKKPLLGTTIKGYHLTTQPSLDHFTVPTVIGNNTDEANTMGMLPSLTFLIPTIINLISELEPELIEQGDINQNMLTWLADEKNMALVEQEIAQLTADDIKAQVELGDILPSTAYEAIVKFHFGLGNGDTTNALLDLTDFYPNNEGELSGAIANMTQFRMMLNDMLFAGPSRKQARETQENNVDATFYQFGYHASFNVWTYNTEGEDGTVDIGDVIKTISCISGACNGSELPFVFNKPLKLDGSAASVSSKDQALMDKMSRLWFSDALFENYQYNNDSVLIIDEDGIDTFKSDWDSQQPGQDPELRQGRLQGLEDLDLILGYL
ncbi:para-nitrobenzyl esterase [Shewanella sp. UCD-FRSSP16_17]|uniref:carboxylesterase family protein n=1 Tax=Shewanella sp. UCD-FRSSP16_17 TaxID=1853256 RepID=UPI0007EEC7D4|nr:carboxylesterase family protein [Shewanella sp. UCD-FRSSP16_17]OBT07102.1 para-nitrobenzyl esterase [Shewanella sp. UCD-FRSSP16_17]